MSDASIDGDLLDAIADELTERYEQRMDGEIQSAAEQAITSGKLADEITGEDAEANPKTREALKVLMRERGLPIVANNNGSWIPVHEDAVESNLESLEGRIAGIKEKKQLLSQNWQEWNGNDDHDVSIPQAVREFLIDSTAERGELIEHVQERTGESNATVIATIDDLETEGFIYDSGDGMGLA